MKLNNLLITAGALALLACYASAAEHPKVIGTWVIDAQKSDFGPMPVMDDLTFKITENGTSFHVTQTGGGQGQQELDFNYDDKEAINQLSGAKLISKHHWEGDAVVGQIKVEAEDGNTMIFKDKITYSADGKVMTLDRDMSGPMGDAHIKLVMTRKAD